MGCPGRKLWLVVSLLAAFSAAWLQAATGVTETTFENHRCLVVGKPGLPADAPVVFILHGFAANADDLLSLCRDLRVPPCLFVLPDAPLSLPGYPPGACAWYVFPRDDRNEITASRDYLLRVMYHFLGGAASPTGRAGKAKARPAILLGFSEGGVMALEGGLHYPGKIAALVCMSGYLPNPKATLTGTIAPLKTPILLLHGLADPTVPVERCMDAAAALDQKGYRPYLKLFRMPHTITAESLAAASRFIREVLEHRPLTGRRYAAPVDGMTATRP